jgi:hypothetical protein
MQSEAIGDGPAGDHTLCTHATDLPPYELNQLLGVTLDQAGCGRFFIIHLLTAQKERTAKV